MGGCREYDYVWDCVKCKSKYGRVYSLTECYILSHSNKQIYEKYESYKCLIIYQGMLCVSFKIGNTFNPEKLRVEVRKKPIF